MLLSDSESSKAFWVSVQEAVLSVLQLIDLRLALLIGLAAFMLAVSFDSSGNTAEAADLINRSALVPVVLAAAPQPPTPRAFYRDDLAQLSTARRLHHGSLTSAIMTNNRLTEAYFFTDLPPEQ